jgi:ligand-binding SRPBCC domain-containing protein
MNAYTLRCQMLAPVSIRDAFAVFEDPHNLARITPPWLNFRILSPDPKMHQGAEFDYLFRWKGLPLKWRTRITEYEPPFFFVDEMLKGPYLYWRHRHTFHPSEDGTVVIDEVDYMLPFGRLGSVVHQFAIARQLKEIFHYRQLSLNEILCGGKAHWTEPSISPSRRTPPSGTASPGTHTRAAS